MPPPLSANLRKMIVEDYLWGIGRNDSAKRLRRYKKTLAQNSVTNVRDEFDNRVEEMGIEAAGEEYGVSSLVAELTKVGEVATANKIELSDMVDGGRVAKKLKDLGVNPRELEAFASEVYQRSKATGISGSMIVDRCTEFEALEQKYGTSYEELKTDFEKMGAELPQKKKELATLRGEISATEKKKGDLFQRYETDEEGLRKFGEVKRFLHSIGLDMENLEDAIAIFTNLKQQKFQIEKVIEMFRIKGSLEDHISDLQRKEATAETKLNQLNKSLGEVNKEIQSMTDILEEGRKMKGVGLSIEQFENIRNLVTKISSARGIPQKEAMKRFEKELGESYDLLLGLGEEVNALRKAYGKLRTETMILEEKQKKEIEKHADNLQNLDTQYKMRLTEIKESIKTLKNDGVKSITEVRDTAVMKIEESSNSGATELSKSFGDRQTKTNKVFDSTMTSLKLVSDQATLDVTNVSSKIGELSTASKDMVDRTKTYIDETNKAIQVREQIGMLKAFLPIFGLVQETKGTEQEVLSVMVMILTKFVQWSKTRKETHESTAFADQLVASLKKEFHSG